MLVIVLIFSDVHPKQFVRESSLSEVIQKVNAILSSNGGGYTNDFEAKMWRAIDNEVHLAECSIFSFIPDPCNDPCASKDTIWSYNFFFYNKKNLNRMIVFMLDAKWMRYDGYYSTNHSNIRSDDSSFDMSEDDSYDFSYSY